MTKKIEDIQLLRALSIILVLFAHLSLPSKITQSIGIQNPGWIGVDFFFVISGFVVTLSFERSGWAVVPFAIKRVFRLYPLLVVFSIVALLLVIMAQHWTPDYGRSLFVVSLDQFLGQLADIFLWNFPTKQNGVSYTTGAMWSLPREFQFYAFFAAIVGALIFIFRGSDTVIRWSLFATAGTMAVIGIVSRLSSYLFHMPGWIGWIQNWCLDLFSLGVTAALVPASFRKKFAERFAPYWLFFLVAALLSLCFASPPITSMAQSTQVSIAFSSLCFVIIVIVAAEHGLGTWIPRSVRGAGNIIGDRSYALYVFHFPLMMMAWYLGLLISPKIISGDWLWPANQLILFCLIAAPSIELLYRKIELPWIRYGASLLKQMKFSSHSDLKNGRVDKVQHLQNVS